ncbi:MAG: nucleotide exchange factor GrpE [Clostridia bacterium]|nr:nucleotide exchange factor GrpE [Clostridia bacterium]
MKKHGMFGHRGEVPGTEKHQKKKIRKGLDDVQENEELQEEMQVENEAAPETEEAGENAQESTETKEPSELEKAQALAEEYLNLAQRVQADFDNFRRRNASVRADAYAEGQRNVAALLLGTLDNLERALESAAGEESPLKSGIELTLKQMKDAYDKLGVTEINRLGEKFDPNLENAVMRGNPDEGEPGSVCMVLQKGYQMGGAVLRHAMVKVVPED